MGSREIGQKSDVLLALDTFGIGTTADFSKLKGVFPHAMEWLKSLVTDGAMASAVDFNIREEMSSRPLAFEMSSNWSITQISSVHRILGEHSCFTSGVMVLIEGDDALDAKFADEMRSWILRMLSLQMR